mmetsp:Transcript_80835/g.131012  ORF Transcript_80835/g.131012 Transcript_80835/m.131012 type:complete len:246 (-) Transcript_80835:209-946(-)
MSPTHFWDPADVWPSLPRVLPASLTPRLNRHHQEQSMAQVVLEQRRPRTLISAGRQTHCAPWSGTQCARISLVRILGVAPQLRARCRGGKRDREPVAPAPRHGTNWRRDSWQHCRRCQRMSNGLAPHRRHSEADGRSHLLTPSGWPQRARAKFAHPSPTPCLWHAGNCPACDPWLFLAVGSQFDSRYALPPQGRGQASALVCLSPIDRVPQKALAAPFPVHSPAAHHRLPSVAAAARAAFGSERA